VTGERDARDTEWLARRLVPPAEIPFGDERRARPVEQHVTLVEGRLDGGPVRGDPQPWKPSPQQGFHAIIQVTRPERHVHISDATLEDHEQSGRVRDVTDVDRLPRRSEQDSLTSAAAGSEPCDREDGRLHKSASPDRERASRS